MAKVCLFTTIRNGDLSRRSTTEFSRLPKVPLNSMVASVLLAFLATAGFFFFIGIMPALVYRLERWNLASATSGRDWLILPCNVYGQAGSEFVVAFLVGRD